MPHNQLRIALETEIPDLRVSAADVDRITYGRDTWPLYQIRLQQHQMGELPGVVAFPRSADQVAAVYRFATRRQVPVTPIGGGSGVCGGGVPSPGGIVLELKAMDEELDVRPLDGVATAAVGWNGQNLEHALNDQGVTAGHFPSSIMCSTLGGWMAARGAGQLSTRYGKFDHRIRAVEWVFPDGTIAWIDGEGPGEGIQEFLCGSEGTLGCATRIRFRVDPLPAVRLFRSYEFKDLQLAFDGIRRLLHHDVHPAVVRLYDPFDSLLHAGLKKGPKPAAAAGAADASAEAGGDDEGRRGLKGRIDGLLKAGERFALSRPALVQGLGERMAKNSLLILMFEGPQEAAAWQASRTDELMAGYGDPLGEGPGRAWFEHRYDVSWKQAGVYDMGGFADTMEVAFPWSRLMEGYRAVRAAIADEVLLLAHFSHVYDAGASIYFTFSAHRGDPKENERLYREIWRRGLDAVVRSGGTITHHHGVGILKARWMADEWKDGHVFLRNLKTAMDPERIANPGKLGL